VSSKLVVEDITQSALLILAKGEDGCTVAQGVMGVFVEEKRGGWLATIFVQYTCCPTGAIHVAIHMIL
jgi:hypothetical protein